VATNFAFYLCSFFLFLALWTGEEVMTKTKETYGRLILVLFIYMFISECLRRYYLVLPPMLNI
jgi:hypothetical protein